MKHINNIIIKASKVCLVATALLSLTTSCSDLLEKKSSIRNFQRKLLDRRKWCQISPCRMLSLPNGLVTWWPCHTSRIVISRFCRRKWYRKREFYNPHGQYQYSCYQWKSSLVLGKCLSSDSKLQYILGQYWELPNEWQYQKTNGCRSKMPPSLFFLQSCFLLQGCANAVDLTHTSRSK